MASNKLATDTSTPSDINPSHYQKVFKGSKLSSGKVSPVNRYENMLTGETITPQKRAELTKQYALQQKQQAPEKRIYRPRLEIRLNKKRFGKKEYPYDSYKSSDINRLKEALKDVNPDRVMFVKAHGILQRGARRNSDDKRGKGYRVLGFRTTVAGFLAGEMDAMIERERSEQFTVDSVQYYTEVNAYD